MPPLFKRAEKLGIPMLILTRPGRLRDLAGLLESCPDLDVSIDHMADVHVDDSEGRQKLMEMVRYPNVYVKISHTWRLSNEPYPWADTHGLVEEVYQTFGAKRIMWGYRLARLSVQRRIRAGPDPGSRRDGILQP